MEKAFICDYCKEEIKTAIVRVDDGNIYHLDCFERFLHPNLKGWETWACPKCKTTGKYWSTSCQQWKMCKLCHGHGYINEEMTKDY